MHCDGLANDAPGRLGLTCDATRRQIVDACVKNGDFKVHKVVASKAFMGAMAALAQGKRVRIVGVRGPVASVEQGLTTRGSGAQGDDVAAQAARLIQTWGTNFESIKDALPGFCETYVSLQAKVRCPRMLTTHVNAGSRLVCAFAWRSGCSVSESCDRDPHLHSPAKVRLFR